MVKKETKTRKKIVRKSSAKAITKLSTGNRNKNVFAGTGISNNPDSYTAAKEAAEMAIKNCGKTPTFAFVFTSSHYDLKKLNKAIADTLPCDYVGATTAGELSNFGFSKHACVVMALSSEYLNFGIGVGPNVLENPQKATSMALKQSFQKIKLDRYLMPYVSFQAMKTAPVDRLIKMKPYFLLLLTPGLGAPKSADNDAIINTIFSLLGNTIPVLGVGAASDEIFVNKHMFTRQGIWADAIITVFGVSDVKIGFGLAHGLKPMKDKASYINKKKGNEILILDNKNSADRYKELTGVDLRTFVLTPETLATSQGQKFIQHPFALQTISGNYIIRHLLAEKPQNTIRFCFSVPDKAALIPMDGTASEMSKATVESVKLAMQDAGSDKVVAMIGFSCLLRQMLQGQKTPIEIENIKSILKGVPFAGFYGVGEISSFKDSAITSQQMSFESLVITDTLISES